MEGGEVVQLTGTGSRLGAGGEATAEGWRLEAGGWRLEAGKTSRVYCPGPSLWPLALGLPCQPYLTFPMAVSNSTWRPSLVMTANTPFWMSSADARPPW